MGLRQRLSATAVRRAAVLVVEVPGWGRTRCAVEQEVRRRGWRSASSPADADVLVVCGRAGTRLTAAVDLVWAQLPGPRARVEVLDPAAVPATLDRALATLSDDDGQRADAGARPPDPAMGIGADEDPTADRDVEPARAGNEDDQGTDDMDMDDMDMDMDDMDMPMPAGIPLAGGGEDRDGLEMDVLHVPLGPVLPGWPAGLVLHCTVQGDVVQEARAEVLPPAPDSDHDGDLVRGSPADRCDRAARILLLAGPADVATATARLRDELLGSDEPADHRPALDRLARRVRRSRTLRWSLPGEVHARLLALLEAVAGGPDGAAEPVALLPLDRLPALVTGQELGAVRLLVAAADLSPATLLRDGAART